ncbi:zinc dependent phospholipase C family protein [Lachnospiraceae bacterium DSM 108991]|uniref:Phospholipase C n=1 Tax=Claveliimonas monacensis TaxID=2779351 RepID=A0ABR9RLN4_9FIRM|nr:zinc dependent phospholipase C family protein [Claveliimonas monacensis]MBE5063874.1 zinc dependent phospholipase C family protein [Claveliimonas monacensis]
MKMKKIVATMLTVTCLLGNGTAVFAQTEDNYTELPQQVIDIANGSDDIYGPGAPISHEENPDARFESGGIDHTHQYIAASALVILNNDKGATVFNDPTNSALLMEGADWPDIWGNETDYMTFAGHFYDPDTAENWMGQSSPTARTRAESYYKQAVDAYNDGDIESAMSYLGRGVHYVSDLNQPHHASNKVAVLSKHTQFESYIDEHRKEYIISGNTLSDSIYQTGVDTNVGDLMYNAAKEAKAMIDLAEDEDTFAQAGEACVQNAITSTTQYIYKFGHEVGIY